MTLSGGSGPARAQLGQSVMRSLGSPGTCARSIRRCRCTRSPSRDACLIGFRRASRTSTRAGSSALFKKNRRPCSGWSRPVSPGRSAISIQAGLLLDEQDIASERPVNPIVRDWVMGLWTERLVGGEPVRSDDPPALFAVYGLSPRAGLRLCRMAGLGKMVLASEGSATGLLHPLNRQRSEWLKDNLRGIESEFEALRPSRSSIDRFDPRCPGATMPGGSGCSPSRGCSPTPSRSGCGGRCNTGHTRS